jgi:hypothetical protein
VSAMTTNYKPILVLLFGILAVAYIPLLISAQTDSSTVLAAVSGLAMQISDVENNVLGKLSSLDQRISALEVTTGSNVQSLGTTLMPMLEAIVGLVAVTLVLCIVNLILLLRRPKEAKAKS